MTFLYLKSCLTDPKQLVRLIVLVLCSAVAAYQLSDCFYKLRHPPVNIHYGFKQNESMDHPALTICRNPPYKTFLFSKYNLSTTTGWVYSSFWRHFDFKTYTLQQFFDDASYSFNEIFALRGLNGNPNNFEVKTTYTLSDGKCYTFLPNNVETVWQTGGGWNIATNHTETVRRQSSYKVYVSGYYAWVHDPREIFSETRGDLDAKLDQFYLEAGEELQIKMKMQKFDRIPTNDNPCISNEGYTKSNCQEECRQNRIADQIGYTAPFLNFVTKSYPTCNSYDCMKKLLTAYYSYKVDQKSTKLYDGCDCPVNCNSTFYNPMILNRKIVEMPSGFMYVFYSNNLITELQETLGYDWNRFLADLGGSLGFLLGLSVLGAIGLVEQLIKVAIKKKQKFDEKEKDKPNDVTESAEKQTDLKNNHIDLNGVLAEMYLNKNYYSPEIKNDDLLTKSVNK